MNMRSHPSTTTSAGLVIACLLAFPGTSMAQVKVITSGGFAAAFREIVPDLERTAGITVTTTSGASQGNGPNTIGAQLRRGVPADVVIMAREGLDELIKEGKIAAGTAVDLARTPVGVAVRAGVPKPDISTVEAFKQTLVRAKSITFPMSTVGIYLTTRLFPQLGIAEQLAAKTTTAGVATVATGAAEIAIQPMSELTHVAGVEIVGLIPADVQYISVFSAAMVEGAKEPDAAKKLIAFLASDRATAAIVNAGMERPRSK